MTSPWVVGLFGLIGTVVGALASGGAQLLVARLGRSERRATEASAARVKADDEFRASVIELLAAKDVLVAEYDTLWQLTGRTGAEDRTGESFSRSLEAWNDYQRRRAAVRLLAAENINEAGGRLADSLYELANEVSFGFYESQPPSEAVMDRVRAGISAADQDFRAAVNVVVPTLLAPPSSAQPPRSASEDRAGATA